MTKYIEEFPNCREQGPKKDDLLREANELCFLADEQGRVEVIEWIKSNVAKREYFYNFSFKDECVRLGAIKSDVEMLKWLGENGCNLNVALGQAIESPSFTLCNDLLKLGADPNSTYEYRTSGLSMIGKRKAIKTNAVGLALAEIDEDSTNDLTKIVQLLLANGAELDKSPVDHINKLVSTEFFSTDNKDLQILAGAELLRQLDKRPDCCENYGKIWPIHQFSKLFTDAVKEVDIEKFPNEKIKEALNVVSVRFKESDPELSLKAEVLGVSTQDEKNKIKARFHLQNALSALKKSAPEVSIEIEEILKKLQTQNISQDVEKGAAVVSSTSQSYVDKEEERRKSQQEQEKKLSPKGSGWSIWR